MKASLSAEALADAEQAAHWYIEQDAWLTAPPHPKRRISVTFGGTPASFTVTS
jgi:hypothetical protein